MPTGPGAIGNVSRDIADIVDGTSDTIMIVEACGFPVIWTQPRDIDLAVQTPGINLNGSKPNESDGWISSYHRPGGHVLFADGHVRYLFSTIDPALLKKLMTIDGNDSVDPNAY